MSQPDEKVYVSEGKGKNFTYATASCQGWRREQEDAEECLPYFDDDASLFVLCDGHGGAEVAKYTVKNLPGFIKNHPKYKEGAISEALKQAFIDFDALLRTDKVMAELHKLAFEDNDNNNKGSPKQSLSNDSEEGNEQSLSKSDNPPAPPALVESSAGQSSSAAGTSSSSNNGSSTIVEDVDIGTLRREARVSLTELLGEYTSVINSESHSGRSHLFSKAFPSPVIRKKEDHEDASNNGGACTSTSSDLQDKQPQPSSSKSEDGEPPQGPSTSTDAQFDRKDLMKQVLDRYFQGVEDSSDDSEYEEDSNDEDDDGDDEGDDDAGYVANKKLRRKKHKRPLGERIDSSTDDDDDDDDDYGVDDQDDDEGEDDEDDDDDDDDGDDDDSEQDADQEEDDDDDDEDVEDEDEDEEGGEIDEENWKTMQDMITPGARAHKPGLDSGCTVVVALIKNSKLYVASAGDSRCIVIKRNGECVPMSFDHKPEDVLERRRIQYAGGRVMDGRVNGGLNLSRAFGDFTYKQSTLNAKNQMITPLPDVRHVTLDPNKIEYIFLACDGIWNSMNNLRVAEFIRKTAQSSDNNLVEICIQLFRNCIAPKTDGDGTGCDNMTCILARFNEPKEEDEEDAADDTASSDLKNLEVKEQPIEATTEPTSSSSQKRSFSEESSTNDVSNVKRRCLRL